MASPAERPAPRRCAPGPESLQGTELGDLYTSLADARELARDEEEHLVGLATRLHGAPVVRVPVQPFEVTDLASLDALGAVMFADQHH